MNVLLVDGPAQGKVMTVDDNASVWIVPIPVPVTIRETDAFEPNFDTALYHIQYVHAFGEFIAIGSIGVGRPSNYDLGRFLLTSEAKSAVRS